MKKIILISLFLSFGFWASADNLTAVVTPQIGSSANGSINLSVIGGAAPFTYSWTGPSGFTAMTEDITDLEEGTYTVTVTDSYCGIATMSFVVGNGYPNAIAENEFQNSIQLFPNPTSDFCQINSSIILKNAKLRIFDITGKLLITNIINGAKNEVSLKALSNGTYIIEIAQENKTAQFKVIKK